MPYFRPFVKASCVCAQGLNRGILAMNPRDMNYHDGIPNIETVNTHLQELFSLPVVRSVDLLRGGHLCKSFIVQTDTGTYFLKQYRHRLSQTVHQIKFAETHFSKNGIPVLMPMNDRFGRPAFLMGKNWYSLFPFVDLKTKQVFELKPKHVQLLGAQLAELHKVGAGVEKDIQPLLLWDKHRFLMEVVEIERILEKRPQPNRVERLIGSMLKKKREFVESRAPKSTAQTLPFNTLLHGDYSYQNVFFSEDDSQIESIYDFEKTTRGPRAFEVARSLFVTCFDDGWEQKNIDLAAVFLQAYLTTFPMPLEELQLGVRMYLTNLAHQTWLEAKVLIKNSYDYVELLEAHARRIDHLEDDIDAFTQSLFEQASQ